MLETLNLSEEQKLPPTTSSEKFTAVLEAVSQKETEPTEVEELKLVEDFEELKDQDFSWAYWMKQPIFLENKESLTEAEKIFEITETELTLNPTVDKLQMDLSSKEVHSNSIDLDLFEPSVLQNDRVNETITQFSLKTNSFVEADDVQIDFEFEKPISVVEKAIQDISKDYPQENVVSVDTEKVLDEKDVVLFQTDTLQEAPETNIQKVTVETTKIDEIALQEKNAVSIIDEEEVDLFLEESEKDSVQAEYGQVIEKTLITQSSKEVVQQQEIVKVRDAEWVNKLENFVVEQIDPTTDIEKTSNVRIQLTPDSLGEMDIELTLKDKDLTAKFVVEYAETKEWLEQKVQELTTKLASQEIQIQKFEIVVSENTQSSMNFNFDENPFFKQQRESAKQVKSLNYKASDELEIEMDTRKKNDAGAGRLSIWV